MKKLNEFMCIMYSLLKDNDKMICSDFHPFTKISDILNLEQTIMNDCRGKSFIKNHL